MCKQCEIICCGKKIGTIEKKGSELVIKRTAGNDCCFEGECSCEAED